jgi:hypothetical protein
MKSRCMTFKACTRVWEMRHSPRMMLAPVLWLCMGAGLWLLIKLL